MRIFALVEITKIILFLLLFVCSCGPQPKSPKLPDRVVLPTALEKTMGEGGPLALWFTTSNYTTSGTLGRLDLKSGLINRRVLTLGHDTQVIPDSNHNLFILNRMTQDSIASVKGSDAIVGDFYALPKGSNPQRAFRDRQGRVWVTTQQSNEVLILSSDLKNPLGSIDLSVLAVASPGAPARADLAQIVEADAEHVIVTAQRLHRTVGAWTPDRQSGVAVINSKTLSLESTHLVDVINPIQVGQNQGKLMFVGAGDFSDPKGAGGRLAHFTDLTFSVFDSMDIPGRIMAADVSEKAKPPALIVWYPAENKSCVEVGNQKIVCDGQSDNGGYVFNSLLRLDSVLFVSYYGGYESQLWVIELGDRVKIQKVSMELPILSMSFGL